MSIGLPQIKIKFKEAIRRTALRAGRGIVAIILDDTNSIGAHDVFDLSDIPNDLTPKNKKYLEWALEGFGAKPLKVIAYVKQSETEIKEALDYFEGTQFNVMTAPYCDNDGLVELESYINKMCANGVEVWGVLGTKTVKPTTENIVYITFEDARIDEDTVTPAELAVIVAGMLAGCPNPFSLTYATVPFLTDIPKITKDTLNNRINQGEIVLIKECGDIRIGRGVTSFTVETEEKGYAYRKIKTVDTMKMIKNDIVLNLKSNYIGKVTNSYDNKLIVCGMISDYLHELSVLGLIEKEFNASIDLEAQKKFLKSIIGDKINEMTDDEILAENTKDKAFFKVSVKLLDTMEDIDINCNI